ncbi:unnamed protein product [Coffea canephora]|uniref:Protein kinase domain-containing protein n=1 Tax=Coffea canephora TaxID=49390 RepID=A0A068V757_COFCA|nr:unnamed protein product [Coffea canephora]
MLESQKSISHVRHYIEYNSSSNCCCKGRMRFQEMLICCPWDCRKGFRIMNWSKQPMTIDDSNLLGKESFGSVYKGTLTDGTVVAAKVFTFLIEVTSRSFDTECEILRNLRHRNLIKVIGTLYSHNHCLDLVQRISMMVDVASVLEYLHFGYAKPVVHCDLKPSNILLDEHMVAHVSDFGIARFLDERNNVMHTKTLATLGYMAPEFGLEGLVSTRIDVYGFGIILMETFSRMKPSDEIFKEDLILKNWKLECVSMIFKLALSCCTECRQDRINMKEVVAALKKIKRQLDTLSDT